MQGLEKEVLDLQRLIWSAHAKGTQQLSDTSALRKTRRDIARAKTIPGEERKSREMTQAQQKVTRTLIGRVVSDKRAKTVTVLVERRSS